MQRRSARLSLQVAVSLALIMVLAWLVHEQKGKLADKLQSIHPEALVLAAALYFTAVVLASRRWQLLLRCRGVEEPGMRLLGDYLLGMFCSTFLPSSVGGDAVRVYELNRRGHSLRKVFLATFQDRLLGFGAMMALGLLGALCYLSMLPSSLAVGFFLIHCAGLLAVFAFMNPRMLLACLTWIGRRTPGVHRLASGPRGERIRQGFSRLLDEPPLALSDLIRLYAVGLASFSLCIAAHQAIGRSLGIDLGFLAFCLIVSLVWVVKLLPVSLGGLGVGETAFVGLLALFGAPAGNGLLLAVLILAIQTGTALLGGVVALARVLRGVKTPVNESIAVEGEQRHAA
jgi:uncharacterized protein (TIRG00374 family)